MQIFTFTSGPLILRVPAQGSREDEADVESLGRGDGTIPRDRHVDNIDTMVQRNFLTEHDKTVRIDRTAKGRRVRCRGGNACFRVHFGHLPQRDFEDFLVADVESKVPVVADCVLVHADRGIVVGQREKGHAQTGKQVIPAVVCSCLGQVRVAASLGGGRHGCTANEGYTGSPCHGKRLDRSRKRGTRCGELHTVIDCLPEDFLPIGVADR